MRYPVLRWRWWRMFACAGLMVVFGVGILPQTVLHAQETSDVGVSAEVPGEEEEVETETPPATGGPGAATIPDHTPPFLFNVRYVVVSPTQAVVLWQTDEEANTVLEYAPDDGVTPFGRVGVDGNRTLSHEAELFGLRPCTGYRYRARSADAYGNEGVSAERVLSMPCDLREPELIGVRVVEITDHSAMVVWTTREPASSVVEYGETATYGTRASVPGFVSVHAVPLAGLRPDTTYHVRVTSEDPSGNGVMSGDITFQTLVDATAPANVGLRAIAGNTIVRLEWSLPTGDIAGVRIVRRQDRFPTGPLDGAVVFDGEGTGTVDRGLQNGTRYYYGAYAYDADGHFASGSIASAMPRAPGDVIPPGEGLPDVVTEPVTPAAPPFGVRLFGADGTLALGAGMDGMVGILAGSPVAVRFFPEEVSDVIVEAYVLLGGATYPAILEEGGGSVDILMPLEAGEYPIRVRVRFLDGALAERQALLRVQGQGQVFIRPLVGPAWRPVAGAAVTLFRYDGASWVSWDGGSYGQPNPVFTTKDGHYVFQVPPGLYEIEVKKQGFRPYRSAALFIDGHVVGIPIKLIALPSIIAEGVEPSLLSPAQQAVAWAGFGVKVLRQWLEEGTAAVVMASLSIFLAVLGAWNAFAFSIVGTRARIVFSGVRHTKGAAMDLSDHTVHKIRCIEQIRRRRVALACVFVGGTVAALSPTILSGIGFGLDVLCALIFLKLDRSCRTRFR